MSKQDKRGRSRSGPPYVQLFHWLRRTEAWRSLAPYSRLLYIEIRARYNGQNNGDIAMSYRDAMDLLGCSNVPVMNGFRELEERGFIRPAVKGSFNWKAHQSGSNRATRWTITELPVDVPERVLTPTYEFKQWTAPPPEPSKHTGRKKKTRSENLTRMALETHPISEGPALNSHANGVNMSRQNGPFSEVDGVKISRSYNLPYTPAAESEHQQPESASAFRQKAARQFGTGSTLSRPFVMPERSKI